MNIQPSKFLYAAVAGIAAGIFATIAQLLLWWTFWDVLPSIFFRDIRYTAAIIFGETILPPPATFDLQALIIATLIHTLLSILYAIILPMLIDRLGLKTSLIAGGIYGLIIFWVNMYGVVIIYPWFVETRDWITVIAHIVFGVSAAGIYKILSGNRLNSHDL